MFFIPQLPDDISLKEFSILRQDGFPVELEFNKRKDIYKSTWDTLLNHNFADRPLEGQRGKNMKEVFINDQYNRPHFLSMFVGKFTLDQYEIDVDSVPKADVPDRKIEALAELAHFVRCIPFKTEGKTTSVWSNPNLVSIMKKGDIQDHAIFLTCLFMGCKKEKRKKGETLEEDDEDEKDKKKRRNKKKRKKKKTIVNIPALKIGPFYALEHRPYQKVHTIG